MTRSAKKNKLVTALPKFRGAKLTNIVDLAAAGVDGLEKLINLVVAHLLAQVGQDCVGC